ncbi:MAG TPA: SurA N-terminal domain-containing protein, partial [Candidatus Angelobacter sp.]|nr:SurA N-terminal domain-containing protein [Candidatus Angelobacter sp.]
MKKLIRKLLRKQRGNDLPLSSRITSETVVQHREHILAGGRRFKYPIQYTRHKLVINAITISIAALIIVIIIGWWQLYPMQNTSEFMYRITKVVPIPVAVVDGQPVLYSDYLMKYRSSINYLEQKEQVSFKTDDGKRQIEHYKQQSMSDAIADAYALKLAKNLDISVSDSELEGFLKEQRESSDVSQQTYDAVILDYYGWSPDEYRHVTENNLLRQKVAYAVDKD